MLKGCTEIHDTLDINDYQATVVIIFIFMVLKYLVLDEKCRCKDAYLLFTLMSLLVVKRKEASACVIKKHKNSSCTYFRHD
ncbi:hypothetical protein JKY79_03745 [Candidatus Babeliales bacterium]|nr:hypothetical protein [Candidatus Babeliales bacterium]